MSTASNAFVTTLTCRAHLSHSNPRATANCQNERRLWTPHSTRHVLVKCRYMDDIKRQDCERRNTSYRSSDHTLGTRHWSSCRTGITASAPVDRLPDFSQAIMGPSIADQVKP